MNSKELFNEIFSDYDNFRELKLGSEFITHSELKQVLEQLKNINFFKIELLGKSVEEREIFSISFGTGKTNILAWSQMHGDEPTATAALFDILNFFASNNSFVKFRDSLLNEVTFHFVPMVNPDGAEIFKRENAFNIDLNRDALRLESYESKILWDYAAKIQPDFGFNLHDQNSYYTAGRTRKYSTISMLAPPIDHVKSINYTREKSMQVICRINETLSYFIPGQIARYNDDHEPRAFGDNFTRNGISSILIESGYHKNDLKKEFVRKLNFIALLSAFHSISEKDFEKIDYTKYYSIPENEELLFDLLLRNLTLDCNGNSFKIDIGINRKKYLDLESKKFLFKGTIAELGDLSIYNGIEEYDMTGFKFESSNWLAVDDPADLNLTGKAELKIINGSFSDSDYINTVLNEIAIG
ncbi:MAG: M14 family zinc carboxypeptidase [Ignavibacteriales bacterium]|nr:M14 family zinc carboxypeptidase [Ignavibacteriales bacterium]